MNAPVVITIDTVIRERQAKAASAAKNQAKAEQGRKIAARDATRGERLDPMFGDKDCHKEPGAPSVSPVRGVEA